MCTYPLQNISVCIKMFMAKDKSMSLSLYIILNEIFCFIRNSSILFLYPCHYLEHNLGKMQSLLLYVRVNTFWENEIKETFPYPVVCIDNHQKYKNL